VRQSLVEPGSSGKFYSVSVFRETESSLRRDVRASDWFGADYSWFSKRGKIIYRFPYQSKKQVQVALNSPFFSLVAGARPVPVKIKQKSYLFEGPNAKGKTKGYLIKGDRATVNAATGGWCEITYADDQKPLEIWTLCDSLVVDAQRIQH